MAKKKPDRWVRLSNGTIEKEHNVGVILCELRALAVNHPQWFEFISHYIAGLSQEMPDYVVARLRQIKFIKPDSDPVEFYDDVKDVIECCGEWSGRKVRFDRSQLLDQNQNDIKPPEEDE